MDMVQSALDYGRQKYGIGGGQMGFQEGGEVPEEGVVPTQDAGGGGNPNAIDPRKAMAYLTGDGAVSSEIAQALEQKVDPQGQLNPTQRAAAAIGVAPNDEARFGLLQHYRTKYNAYSGAAKAALSRGDMGEAAKNATMAMDAVPNGQRTQFAPAPGGIAMMSQPAFAGPQAPQQAPQQSFQDGGEVEEDDEDADTILAAEYHAAGAPPTAPEDDEVIPTAGSATPITAPPEGEDAPSEAAGEEPAAPTAGEQREPVVPVGPEAEAQLRPQTAPGYQPPAAEAPQEDVPEQQALAQPGPMPAQTAAPQVLTPQQLIATLDQGFDEQLKTAGDPGIIDRIKNFFGMGGSAVAAPAPAAAPAGVVPTATPNPIDQGFARENIPNKSAIEAFPAPAMTSYALDNADAQRAAQLQGWDSAEEKAGPGWLARAGQRALNPPSWGTLDVPPATTGSEAATRTPANSYAPGQEQRFRPAGEPVIPTVTAPVTATAAPPAGPRFAEGAVINENRVNPFTGRVRQMAPGTFGSRQEAARLGGVVPTEEAILDRARRGAPTEYSAQRRGGGAGAEGYRPTERELPTGNYGDSTGTLNVRTKPQDLGVFGDRGGAPEGPLSARQQAVRDIQDEAARLYPWVGRDQAKRDAYTAAGMKAYEDRTKAENVARITGDSRVAGAEAGAAARVAAAESGAKARIDTAEKNAAAALERVRVNNAARTDLANLNNQYKDARQLNSLNSNERRDAAKILARTLDNAETNKVRMTGQQLLARPGIKPEQASQMVNSLADSLGLRQPAERFALVEMLREHAGGVLPSGEGGGAAPTAPAAPAAPAGGGAAAAAPTREQLREQLRSAPVGAEIRVPDGRTMRRTATGWIEVR